MLSIKDLKIFIAKTPLPGFQVIQDVDLPFAPPGCLHFQATVRILFIKLGTLRFALCVH